MNIISLTFSNSLDNHKNIFVKLQSLVDNVNKKIDLIIFPEKWLGFKFFNLEFLKVFKKYAQMLKTFLVIPLYIEENEKKYNRLFVISPLGEIVFTYNKCSIYYKELNVLPGNKDSVVTWIHPSTNLKVGFLICFDINYPNLWNKLADNDADLIVWTSSYEGGKKLNNYAGIHHYYIVSSTLKNYTALYDICGDTISEKKELFNYYYIPSPNVRNIYHFNKNLDILSKIKHRIILEQQFEKEQWLIIWIKDYQHQKVKKTDATYIRNQYDEDEDDNNGLFYLQREYGLMPLRKYLKYNTFKMKMSLVS